jgi:hypothetical protein
MDALDKFSYICFKHVVFQLPGYTATFYTSNCVSLDQYSSVPSYDINGKWFQLSDYFLYQNAICLVITLQDLHQSCLAGYVKIKRPMYVNISTCRRSIKVHRWNCRHLNPDTRCNTGNSATLQPPHPLETFKQDSEFAPELYGDYVIRCERNKTRWWRKQSWPI